MAVRDPNSKIIVDCFTFYNELEMLNYRLSILNDVVDYFVIVEATHTHVGKEKPLFFGENQHLYSNFLSKIIHVVVDDFPHKYPNVNIENNDQWINENYQRSSISRGLDKISFNDNDLIVVSDLDEIPNPNTLLEIKQIGICEGINALEMDFYYYNLHSRFLEKWDRARIISYKSFKDLNTTCQGLRDGYGNCIPNGGWHLSYFGDSSFIKNKIVNFGHQEFNNDNYTDIDKIEERIRNSTDLYGRHGCNLQKIPLEENNNLPPQYETYLAKLR
jgi:beta-1,4-mannosyl-glycoprotein beta-1,4-N-acetylglucosaminyltransferase